MNGKMISNVRKLYRKQLLLILVLLTAISGQVCGMQEISASDEKSASDQAVFINIGTNFDRSSLAAANRQISRALDQGVKIAVFNFSGAGRSFDSFSELAKRISRLHSKENVRTIAFIPDQAKGMSVLAVLACREIYADQFAQIGQVIPPGTADIQVDQQSLEKRLTGLAEAGGHNTMLAAAMANKRMSLYQVQSGDQKKLVDLKEFQDLVQAENSQWKMVGSGPIVTADQVLLLSGREALELGLVKQLVEDQEELKNVLGIRQAEIQHREEISSDPDKISPVDPNAVANESIPENDVEHKAVFITCSEMIDEGLLESIKRRTQEALDGGATYIIYEMDTYGGRVDSALAIHKYILTDINHRAHTVAYVRTDAISAGTLISVACEDIIMKANTKIGDCAPIVMGGTIEGVEREKIETVLRTYFRDAARTNGYPAAICEAMVTMRIEVWRVKNLQTGKYEYFKGYKQEDKEADDEDEVSKLDPYKYDVENKVRIDRAEDLLTFDAATAFEYDLARTVVEGLDDQARKNVLKFLEERDNVEFPRPAPYLETNWSEQMVRWITSPTVSGILLMVALLGIYAELNSPGVGLPGAVAVVALVILFGSKFTIGMANWWEIALFVLGILLLLAEIFVIPGFGIAGIAGILCTIIALLAMIVQNPPGQLPVPTSPQDWESFQNQLIGMVLGMFGFVVGAYLLGRYLPGIPVANRLILQPPKESEQARGIDAAPAAPTAVQVGQEGISISSLRPSGIARIDNKRVNVVTRGELIDPKQKIKVVAIVGNSIVVTQVKD